MFDESFSLFGGGDSPKNKDKDKDKEKTKIKDKEKRVPRKQNRNFESTKQDLTEDIINKPTNTSNAEDNQTTDQQSAFEERINRNKENNSTFENHPDPRYKQSKRELRKEMRKKKYQDENHSQSQSTTKHQQSSNPEMGHTRMLINSDLMNFNLDEYAMQFIKVRQQGDDDIDSLQQEQREQTILLQEYLAQAFKSQDHVFQTYEKEIEEGNIEYKEMLLEMTKEKFDNRTNQMRWRLGEGLGKAIYMIGLADDGTPNGIDEKQMALSLIALGEMAKANKSDVVIVKFTNGLKGVKSPSQFQSQLEQQLQSTTNNNNINLFDLTDKCTKVAKVLIRQNLKSIKFDINLLLLGSQGSGKTTLLSVLMSDGELDDGQGKMRSRLIKHYHQFKNPQTSQIDIHYLGFDSSGKVVNSQLERQGNFSSTLNNTLMDFSTKILTFIDIGGHERAEKSLMQSLCSMHLEYALLVISATTGITKVTEDHMKYAQMFKLPLIIVLTQRDQVVDEKLQDTLIQIRVSLRKNYPGKVPILYRYQEDIQIFTNSIANHNITPLFMISNRTGEGLKELQAILANIPINQMHINHDQQTEYSIHGTFPESEMTQIKNPESIIFSGTVIKGSVKRGQQLKLGPFKTGNKEPFFLVTVKNIQSKRSDVFIAPCGQICTVCIETGPEAREWLIKNPKDLRKGMVLVSAKTKPRAATDFLAEITLFDKQEKVVLKPGYMPVVNMQTSRQAAKIILQQLDESQESQQLGKLTLKNQKSRSVDTRTPKPKYILKVFSKNLLFMRQPKGSMDQSDPTLKNKLSYKKKSMDQEKQEEINTRSFSPMVQSTLSPQAETSQKGMVDSIIIQKQKKLLDEDDIPTITFEPNKKYQLRLRFQHNPEYISIGQKLIINDNSLKAVGTVQTIYYS